MTKLFLSLFILVFGLGFVYFTAYRNNDTK